jgi:predicted  nucleic acid-binding Zn-ribbon protein
LYAGHDDGGRGSVAAEGGLASAVSDDILPAPAPRGDHARHPSAARALARRRADRRARGREARLAGRRAASSPEREKGLAAVEAAQAALVAAEQEQRRHEAAVADREALVAKLEGQQHQIKTNEAYKVLLHEIDQARAAISDAETKILEAMEGIETRARRSSARAAAKGVDERTAQQERVFAEREKSLDQTLGNLRRDREALVGGVDAAQLARYDRIARAAVPRSRSR